MLRIGKRILLGVLAFSLSVMSIQIEAQAAMMTGAEITDFTLSATSEYSSTPITNAKDQNVNTIWESNWSGGGGNPENEMIAIDVILNEKTSVGYMKITPRQGSDIANGDGNGRWYKAVYTKYDELGNQIGEPIEETYPGSVSYGASLVPSDEPFYVAVNDEVKKITITVKQSYAGTATMAELNLYAPQESGITEVTTNSQQNATDSAIEKAFDGNANTYWHSAWGSGEGGTVIHPSETTPVNVIISRDNHHPMNELLYTTRPASSGSNGNILKMNIYTSNNKDDNSWKLLNQVEWNNGNGTKRASLGYNTDQYVKLEIIDGYGDNGSTYASAAEFAISTIQSKDDIDTSLLDEVASLKLSLNHYQGWESSSAQELIQAYTTAQTAYNGDDLAAIFEAFHVLSQKYEALVVDKKPLIDKIQEAQQADLVGKNASSIANLKKAIENAKEALEIVKLPSEVAFEVTELNEAILALSDTPLKDIQNISDDEYARINNFNEGWLFRESTAANEAVQLDESQFTTINLPHDFSISHDFSEQGEAESAFLLGGTGWYRKHMIVPEALKEKTIQLVFDGAYMDTTLYVNGNSVGENHYGYNRFTFDISDYLICDGVTDNVIAVKTVNNVPSSRWYSGSGIERDVTLVVMNETHIDDLGTFISTPSVSSPSAQVHVENTIINANENTKIQTSIFDAEGNQIAQSAKDTITGNIAKQDITVNHPTLWTVKSNHPALYTVECVVYENDIEVDRISETIGFKTLEFDRDNGFKLNGESMKLKGVCMHMDQGALGGAVNYHAVYRQMKIMKEMGVNAIRVTHNPAPEALLKACDELGLLVINEAFDHLYYYKNGNHNDFARWFNQPIVNGPLGSESCDTWAEYVARQMVKSSRNHASILMYSVGNELLEGGGSDQNYPAKIAEICNWFHEEDPYHLPTIGDNKAKGNDTLAVAMCDEVAKAGGVVGFNYANRDQYINLRNAHPDWILYGSETSSAFHSRDVYWTDGRDNDNLLCTDYENEESRAGWGHSASTAWRIAEADEWNLGEFVWTGFDYLGEPTPWNGIGTGSVSQQGPAPRSSYFGIVDTTGFPKDIYYLYHSLWNDNVRTLHISDSWNSKLLKNGNQVKVQVFTDADKVVLECNGKEIGTKLAVQNSVGRNEFDGQYFAQFTLEYEPGTISVKAYDKNSDGTFTEVTNTVGTNRVTTSTEAVKTKLTADKNELICDGYDLSYITVDLLDKDGNFVPDANQKLTFSLEGEGRIVGVDNGNQADTQSFRIDEPTHVTRKSFNGKALVILQSTKRAGTIKLHVKGAGLETNTITLNSVPKQSEAAPTLTAFELVSKYTMNVNETLQLPKTITGIYSDGSSKELKVTWDLSSFKADTAGIYSVKGSVLESTATAMVTVNVYNSFAAAEDYSTVIHEGSALSLPSSRNVYYTNGESAGEFAVVWDYYDAATFTQGNTYTVNGTILIAQQRIPVTAKIRVVAPLPQSRNIARLENDMPILSESCTKPADRLAAINNGVIVSDSENERWTDWNVRDTDAVSWVGYEWQNEYTISDIVAYIFTKETDSDNSDPKTLELRVQTWDNKTQSWIEQEVSYITAISYKDGDGKTTVNLKQPVTTSKVRFIMDKKGVNLYTGLTELEVFEYVAKEPADTNNKMTGITINNEAIKEFDPEINGYELIVSDYPSFDTLQIAVQGIADTATSLIIKDPIEHSIKVLIRSESGSENIYTFQYIINVNTDALQTLYDECIAIKNNHYTEDSWNALQEALVQAEAALKQNDQNIITKAYENLLKAKQELKKQEGESGDVIVEDVNEEDKEMILSSLSKELKEKVDQILSSGNDVIVAMKKNQQKPENMDEDEKAQLNQMKLFAIHQNLKCGTIYDLSLLIRSQNTVIGEIHELKQPITISLTIPDELLQADREFAVLRYHEGKVNYLKATVKGNSLSFESDRFSIFMLVYRDQDITQNPNLPNHPIIKPNNPTKPDDTLISSTRPFVNDKLQGGAPNTGDTTMAFEFMLSCLGSMAILSILYYRKRKQQA